MRGIVLCIEGGGANSRSRSKLRFGMETFLEEMVDLAKSRKLSLKLMFHGSRNETFKKFKNEFNRSSENSALLLVDSEGNVEGASPIVHLQDNDGWDMADMDSHCVHLMVQTMEAWMIADVESLEKYYGQKFQKSALPSHENPEKIDRRDLIKGLMKATANTQKGKYDKIHHAGDLLECVDPAKVRRRCKHCARLFQTLERIIEGEA